MAKFDQVLKSVTDTDGTVKVCFESFKSNGYQVREIGSLTPLSELEVIAKNLKLGIIGINKDLIDWCKDKFASKNFEVYKVTPAEAEAIAKQKKAEALAKQEKINSNNLETCLNSFLANKISWTNDGQPVLDSELRTSNIKVSNLDFAGNILDQCTLQFQQQGFLVSNNQNSDEL